jgi:hypothetical protein
MKRKNEHTVGTVQKYNQYVGDWSLYTALQ